MQDRVMINIGNEIRELKTFNDEEISYTNTPEGMECVQIEMTNINGETDKYNIYLWRKDFNKLMGKYKK